MDRSDAQRSPEPQKLRASCFWNSDRQRTGLARGRPATSRAVRGPPNEDFGLPPDALGKDASKRETGTTTKRPAERPAAGRKWCQVRLLDGCREMRARRP